MSLPDPRSPNGAKLTRVPRILCQRGNPQRSRPQWLYLQNKIIHLREGIGLNLRPPLPASSTCARKDFTWSPHFVRQRDASRPFEQGGCAALSRKLTLGFVVITHKPPLGSVARLKLNCGCKCGNQTKAGSVVIVNRAAPGRIARRRFNHERPSKKESRRLPPACRPLSRSRPHGLHRATEGRPAVKGANLELSSRSDRASCDSPSQAQDARADIQSRK